MKLRKESTTDVRDSNGKTLADGDTVLVIEDVKVKVASIPPERGSVMIKNIRRVEDDSEHVEGDSDKVKGLVLKACFPEETLKSIEPGPGQVGTTRILRPAQPQWRKR